MQAGNEGLETADVIIVHVALEVVQPSGNQLALRLEFATEPAVVDLRQRGAFDLVLQSGMLRMVFPALLAPEHGVLRLGLKDHSIEVEKCCLQLFHETLILKNGCKGTTFFEFTCRFGDFFLTLHS